MVIASEQQVSLFQSPVALCHTWKHVTIWSEIGCQASCLQMDTEKSVYTLPDGVQNLRRGELKRICAASASRSSAITQDVTEGKKKKKRRNVAQICSNKQTFFPSATLQSKRFPCMTGVCFCQLPACGCCNPLLCVEESNK